VHTKVAQVKKHPSHFFNLVYNKNMERSTKGETAMTSQLPPQDLSGLITQWIARFETHKKKIATEEKITEMKLGAKTAYYIQHAEESTLPSTDKRRLIIHQYKSFISLIDHLTKDQKATDEINHLLERAKATISPPPSKKTPHTNLGKIKQLVTEFQLDLNKFIQAKKLSEPSGDIKRG
jgi:hypothetical protein